MNYAKEHMAMNLLRWHRDRKAAKRRQYNSGGALRAKGLLNRMDKEAGRK